MKAMIMAAGVGSRLMPLTTNICKPLVPIAGKPTMEHIIELLKRHKVTDIVANLHYHADKIADYFGGGEEYQVNISYSFEEKLRGTAGGVKKVERFFDGTFLIISGDALTDIDIEKMYAFHREKKALATIALKEVSDPHKFGVVITDKDNRILRFQEKPEPGTELSRLANTGVYIFEKEILDLIPANTFYDFGKDLFPRLVEEKVPFFGYAMEGYWCDIGSLDQYHEANRDALLGKVHVDIPGERTLWGYMGSESYLEETAKITYPVYIGRNAHIGENVTITGPTVIGDNCIIESGSVIEDAVIWNNVRVGAKSHLSGCVVGNDCYLETGVMIADGAILSDEVRVKGGALIPPKSKVGSGQVVLK